MKIVPVSFGFFGSITAATFFSGFASAGLSAIIAVKLYVLADSSVLTAGVYLIQSVASILFMHPTSRWLNKPNQTTILLYTDLSLCVLSVFLIVALQIGLFAGLLFFLLLKGVLEMMSRIAKERVLKAICDSNDLTVEQLNVKYMLSSFAGSTAALLMILGGVLSPGESNHLYFFSLAYVTSVAIWLLAENYQVPVLHLSDAGAGSASVLVKVKNALSDPHIRTPFVFGVLIISLFQSFNQISRTLLATSWLSLSGKLAYSSELFGIIGIAVTLLYLNIKKISSRVGHMSLGLIFTLIFVAAPMLSKNVSISLMCFLIYMIIFEFTYSMSINVLLKNTAQDFLTDVLLAFDVTSMLFMTLLGIAFAMSTDLWGIKITSYIVQSCAVFFLVCIYVFDRTVFSDAFRLR